MIAFPSIRATSEPPPDHDEEFEPMSSTRHVVSTAVSRIPSNVDGRTHLPSLPSLHASDTEEYTWDWGNFPQKTPIRATFPHALGHPSGASVDHSGKGKARLMSEAPDPQRARARVVAKGNLLSEDDEEAPSYGQGGRLTVDKSDSTRFRVFIEGRTMEFELAVIPPEQQSTSDGKELHAGRLGGEDEVEDEQRFEDNKIDFHRFLLDSTIVDEPDLVLRWAGDKYVDMCALSAIEITQTTIGSSGDTTVPLSWMRCAHGESLHYRISGLCSHRDQYPLNRCPKTSPSSRMETNQATVAQSVFPQSLYTMRKLVRMPPLHPLRGSDGGVGDDQRRHHGRIWDIMRQIRLLQ